MCRNITTLRGLEPPATAEEIEAAARQFVRKISGVSRPSGATGVPVDKAVRDITAAATALLAELPPRRQPPPTLTAATSRGPGPARSEPNRSPRPVSAHPAALAGG
jgi:hypothetical protein